MTKELIVGLAAATCTLLFMFVEHRFGIVAARYIALALGSLALGYFLGTLVPR